MNRGAQDAADAVAAQHPAGPASEPRRPKDGEESLTVEFREGVPGCRVTPCFNGFRGLSEHLMTDLSLKVDIKSEQVREVIRSARRRRKGC